MAAPGDFFATAGQGDGSGGRFPQFGPFWANRQGPAFNAGQAGAVIQLGGVLFAANFQTALTAITTAQTLISIGPAQGFVPGILNVTGKYLRLYAAGIFTQAAVAGTTKTIALTFGGQTLVSITEAVNALAETNGQWIFEVDINTTAVGIAGTLETHAGFGVQQGATLSVALPFFFDQNTAPSAGIDLTPAAANGSTLALTVASNNSISSFQLRQILLEVLN